MQKVSKMICSFVLVMCVNGVAIVRVLLTYKLSIAVLCRNVHFCLPCLLAPQLIITIFLLAYSFYY